MIVVVLAIAVAAQAPQLAVAEFAPTAQQQLEAPPTTAADTRAAASRRGRGPTTTQPRAVTATTAPDSTGAGGPPTSVVTRGRPCFGDPPRQLPDPRSPGCLAAIFEGDNGGATAKGVSATEIRVAVPLSLSGDNRLAVDAVFEYFNLKFELYGRRLVPVYLAPPSGNVTQQRSFAADIGMQGIFAAFDTTTAIWFPTYFQELARQGVVAISAGTPTLLADREMFDPLHPYVWSVFPSMEQNWRSIGSFVCAALAGRSASHAGPGLEALPRKFGVIAAGDVRVPSPRVLLDELARCDVQPEVVEWVATRDGPTAQTTALNRFKSAGVTTLLCACTDYHSLYWPQAANTMNWVDPEWVAPVFTDPTPMDEYWTQRFFTPEQRSHLFGLRPLAKAAPVQVQWWLNAARELAPAAAFDNRYAAVIYDQLLVLASGIQAAGPALSPATFGAGLQSSMFPNTGAGQEPYFQPGVGFGPGDHSLVDDYSLAWWEASVEPFGPQASLAGGSWCYLDRGARFRPGTFPADADARFFDPARGCR